MVVHRRGANATTLMAIETVTIQSGAAPARTVYRNFSHEDDIQLNPVLNWKPAQRLAYVAKNARILTA